MSEMMTLVSRDAWMATAKRRYTTADVQGLGTIRIQSLSAGEVGSIESAAYTENQKRSGSAIAKWKARFVAAAVVNANGEREFADKDIAAILSFDHSVIDRAYDAVAAHCKLNEITSEDAEKNSETTHDDCLPSN